MCHVEGSACTNHSGLNTDMHAEFEKDKGKELLSETMKFISDNEDKVYISLDVSPAELPGLIPRSHIEIFNLCSKEEIVSTGALLPGWKDRSKYDTPREDEEDSNNYCIHNPAELKKSLDPKYSWWMGW